MEDIKKLVDLFESTNEEEDDIDDLEKEDDKLLSRIKKLEDDLKEAKAKIKKLEAKKKKKKKAVGVNAVNWHPNVDWGSCGKSTSRGCGGGYASSSDCGGSSSSKNGRC